MGDLGLHVLPNPVALLAFAPTKVFPLLSKVVEERPDGKGGMAACETWDNAILACRTEVGASVVLETKRIAPGHMNSWALAVYGTEASAEFLHQVSQNPSDPTLQAWKGSGLGRGRLGLQIRLPNHNRQHLEFGFSDAIVQMWASFCDELVNGENMIGDFRCASPAEAWPHTMYSQRP